MTANKKPILEQVASTIREKELKLFMEMADSHWLQCTADEEDEFLVKLVECGHKDIAAFYESKRREDREDFLNKCREAAEHIEDLRGDQSGLV